MARNRYGWEKRAKEIARKQKHDEKIKRRQNKPEAEVAGKEVDTESPEGESGGLEPEDSPADQDLPPMGG